MSYLETNQLRLLRRTLCEEPWKLEEKLISTLHLPLNLDQNVGDEFLPVLSGLRKAAKIRARTLPFVPR